MQLEVIPQTFTICKLDSPAAIDWTDPFCFVGKTDEECSLVCATARVPGGVLERDDGWRAFRIKGVLDFSLIGILSKLSALLADNAIGIFAVSTYNTDYILTKQADFQRALQILEQAGYEIRAESADKGEPPPTAIAGGKN